MSSKENNTFYLKVSIICKTQPIDDYSVYYLLKQRLYCVQFLKKAFFVHFKKHNEEELNQSI